MDEQRQAILIADLGFGDAGKGSITDYLTRELATHTVVRYNGGPQAAHTVVTADGKHHTFSQFGSGTFLPSTRTLLSRFMLTNPLNMLKEERHLASLGVTDALQRMMIDRRALVITPFQRAINRLREIARGDQRHGSCGEGVGECMSDALTYGDNVLFAGDLQGSTVLRKKLHFLRDAKQQELKALSHQLPNIGEVRRECSIFTDPNTIDDCFDVYRYFCDTITLVDETDIQNIFAQSGTLLFEGAQGVLLDENYGFAPYTTWSTTTFANAETLLQEHHFSGEVTRLGLLRAYATRHGAGPFPTEDRSLTLTLPDQHNGWNDWQRTFRVGYFDMVMARYAREVLGELDYLALTNIDRLQLIPEWKLCQSYACHDTTDQSPFFEQKDGHISRIKVPCTPDLIKQEQLTQKIFACAPEYEILPPHSGHQYRRKDRENYLALLAERLEVPIAIASWGPTAANKYHNANKFFQKAVVSS